MTKIATSTIMRIIIFMLLLLKPLECIISGGFNIHFSSSPPIPENTPLVRRNGQQQIENFFMA